jgi:hypothetical protein
MVSVFINHLQREFVPKVKDLEGLCRRLMLYFQKKNPSRLPERVSCFTKNQGTSDDWIRREVVAVLVLMLKRDTRVNGQ